MNLLVAILHGSVDESEKSDITRSDAVSHSVVATGKQGSEAHSMALHLPLANKHHPQCLQTKRVSSACIYRDIISGYTLVCECDD